MQPAGSPIIEETKGRVAPLLDFGDDETGSDGVNGARRNIDNIATSDFPPGDPLGDRSVGNGLAELFRSQPPVEAESNAGVRLRGEDMPSLRLSARFADQAGESVSRMDLDRQRLEREKQFQEQGGLVGRGVRPLIPDLTNLAVCSAGLAPQSEMVQPRVFRPLASRLVLTS